MQKKRSFKIIGIIVLCIITAAIIASCGLLQAVIGKLKGELVGNDYVISQYDNYGNRTLQVRGDKITMNADVDSNGEPTSYIDITIDGYEWEHVGSTLVFAQNGADMITDFTLPNEIDTTNNGQSLGLMAADRFVNKYRNYFGKSCVVLISSQDGVPIGLFQGDNCYQEVPSDLPKTTLVSIDGKMVYVHRADIDIFPTAMFDNKN